MRYSNTQKKLVNSGLAALFLLQTMLGNVVLAQGPMPIAPNLVSLSPMFDSPRLKGLRLHPDNPFQFDFIIEPGSGNYSDAELKQQSAKLISYFLAGLTMPEDDLWVNLSPYEPDSVIPQELTATDLGRDLLTQDYFLKQLCASLTYPESPIGKEYWQSVYRRSQAKYGNTNVPVETLNKVWVAPSKAVVYKDQARPLWERAGCRCCWKKTI